MAALVGTQKNPVIHRYYIKLITGGKPKKLALVACMRKLLTILNDMVRRETHWDQKQRPKAKERRRFRCRQLICARSRAR